jgi:hypothetical protein
MHFTPVTPTCSVRSKRMPSADFPTCDRAYGHGLLDQSVEKFSAGS